MIAVQTLIDALKTCDPTAAVILSSDAEGNDYHHLQAIDDSARFTTVHNQIEFHHDDGTPCVVFYPEHEP